MKKIQLPLFALAFLSIAVLACSITIPYGSNPGTIRGSGNMTTEERSVSGIKAVELAMNGSLHIEYGDTEALTVKAEDNLLPYIETLMRGNTLLIRVEPGANFQTNRSIDFTLTVTELTDLSVSSSGDISASALDGSRCSVDISSSGSIDLDAVNCTTLTVSISSSGGVNIASGYVEQQSIRISSSGDYDARDVEGRDADITISSSGSATVRSSDRLTGTISSSGNIYYFGDPRVEVRTTSSGDVERLGN
ncbi:MAG: head GIN domain-containing protein [Anaerolineales bacterium]